MASADLRHLTHEERTNVLRDYFRRLFTTTEGATVLDELRRIARTDRPSFVIDDPSGRLSAFLEGRRYMLLYIEAMSAGEDGPLARLLARDERIT